MMLREPRSAVSGVLFILGIFPASALATPPGYPAHRIATIALERPTEEAVVDGLRQRDGEIRQTLGGLNPKWRNYVILWDQAEVKVTERQGKSYIPDETRPNRPPLQPQPKVFVVTVPIVGAQARWTLERGRVVTGYRRARERVSADRHEETVIEGGKRTARSTGTARQVGDSVILGVQETRQHGDEPIYAETATWRVTRDGVVYF